MKTKFSLFTAIMLIIAAYTAIAQNANDIVPPSKHVTSYDRRLLPNNTVNRKKFLQRSPERATNLSLMPHISSFNINEVRKNPAYFKQLILQQRRDYETSIKRNTLPDVDLKNTSSISSVFHLTKDINALAESYPNNNNDDFDTHPSFAVLKNVVYFAGDDGTHGIELWRSDGTASGTYMVKDIEPGITASNPMYITAANGKLFFNATTTANGSEPWVSDGTGSGTQLLMDILFMSNGSYPHEFVALDNAVYFVTDGGMSVNSNIWKTDGTTKGTIDIGAPGEYIEQLTAANGYLFFTLFDDASFSFELWSKDSSGNSTQLLSGGTPTQFTSYNNKLFFSQDNGSGRKLWVSDGTAAGTRPAPHNHNVVVTTGDEFTAGPLPIVDNVLYVPGISSNNTGALYKYDAFNTDGLVKVKVLAPNTFIVPSEMETVNSKLYFKAYNNSGGLRNELWYSKGTAASTQLIQQFEKGEDIYNLYNGGGILYFVKNENSLGTELWRIVSNSLGTSTKLVSDIFEGPTSSYPSFLTAVKGKLFFSATDDKSGNELYMTGGTPTSTGLVKDINTVTTSSSDAGLEMTSLGNNVLFNAYNNVNGSELYRSDGTAGGTYLLNDIREGELSSSPFSFLSKNSAAYFIGYSSDSTNAIYKTIGTKKGLQKITPDYTKYADYYIAITNFSVADNGIVFYVLFNKGYNQLWRSDGTAAGTFMLYSDLYGTGLSIVGNTIFFVGIDAAHGFELWKSDGTIAGTALVKDIYRGNGNAMPNGMYVFKNELFFGAYDGTYHALWKSDGTKAGTVKVKNNLDLVSGSFCISNNLLYINATDYSSEQNSGLWKTDGTNLGTKPLKKISPNNLTNVNGTAFFTVEVGVSGSDLWKSDGTSVGTQRIKNFTSGLFHSDLENLVSYGGMLYFTHNLKLWSSDGTNAGTIGVTDAVISKVQVYNLVSTSDKLFASGYTNHYGTELYVGNANNQGMIAMTKVANEKAVNTTLSFNTTLYPNPTASGAKLQITGSTKSVSVSISDMNGIQLWQSSNINTMVINLPTGKLVAGTYLVTITNGKESKTIKLIKQ